MHYSCIQPVLELIGTHAKDITLSAPEPDDPQDAVVAQQYLRDYQTFVGTARYWTETLLRRPHRLGSRKR
ncbi:hypothetical protein D5086_030005 [Populus alba]|uniref:Uncharacterized protein n=1 Tax=Populus alba TaxID=43335 RepID=A0ACC4AMA8_POPAL